MNDTVTLSINNGAITRDSTLFDNAMIRLNHIADQLDGAADLATQVRGNIIGFRDARADDQNAVPVPVATTYEQRLDQISDRLAGIAERLSTEINQISRF